MRPHATLVSLALLFWLGPLAEARADGGLDRDLNAEAIDPAPTPPAPFAAEWGADIVSGVCGLGVSEFVGKFGGGEAGFGLRVAGVVIGTVVCHYANKSVTAVLIPETPTASRDLQRLLSQRHPPTVYVVGGASQASGTPSRTVPLGEAIGTSEPAPHLHSLGDLLRTPDDAPLAGSPDQPSLFDASRNGGSTQGDDDATQPGGGAASMPVQAELHLDPGTIERLIHGSAGRPMPLATLPLASVPPVEPPAQ